MQERQLLARDRVLLDVNALAIYLVECHPGHTYIAREIEFGFRVSASESSQDYG